MKLENQIAVITGAAAGIGRGITLALAKRGVRTILLDCDQIENEKTAHDAAMLSPAGSAAYQCDIGKIDEIDEVFNRIIGTEGRVDILVNNAGVFSTMSFVNDSYEDVIENYNFNMNVNARGTLLCSKKVAPGMAERHCGQILNVVTNHMKRYLFPPSANEHCYDASKWAQYAFNESLDCELSQYGIRVNAICPASTRTPMLRNFFDSINMPLTVETIGECSGHASLLEIEDVGEAACNILEWDNDQPTGKAFLLMFPEDCEKLKYGYCEELAK